MTIQNRPSAALPADKTRCFFHGFLDLTPHSSLREVVSLPLAFMVSARPHDGHCFGGTAWSEGPSAKHCTISHEVAATERMKTKTRTRKLWIGLAWNDSVTNLPKASTFVCRASMEDDCAIAVGCSSAREACGRVMRSEFEVQSAQKAVRVRVPRSTLYSQAQ